MGQIWRTEFYGNGQQGVCALAPLVEILPIKTASITIPIVQTFLCASGNFIFGISSSLDVIIELIEHCPNSHLDFSLPALSC